jgi:hypothetical protein
VGTTPDSPVHSCLQDEQTGGRRQTAGKQQVSGMLQLSWKYQGLHVHPHGRANSTGTARAAGGTILTTTAGTACSQRPGSPKVLCSPGADI